MMHEEDNSDRLPDSLIAELRKADKSSPLITAKVDRTVANLAHEQFSSRPGKHRHAAPAWLAVAATMVLAVFLLQTKYQPETDITELYTDVDKSGQIDIADVLALARRNGRKITQAELDAFALRVVSLADNGDAS